MSEMADQDIYQVKLTSFEGPLDLLLYLIKKNELDIYDIPIALIVEQYLAYLELLRRLNLDVAGEFLVMAATLTQIKSALLLPREGGEEAEEEGPDPRAELVQKLLEYQRFKEAAQELIARPVLGRDVFIRQPTAEATQDAALAAGMPGMSFEEVGVFELLGALKEVMDRAKITNWHEVTMERISIMDRINQILALLKEVEHVTFDQLFTAVTTRELIIATFLALLELIRLKVIKAHQEQPYSPIYIVRAVTIDDRWLTENLPLINGARS